MVKGMLLNLRMDQIILIISKIRVIAILEVINPYSGVSSAINQGMFLINVPTEKDSKKSYVSTQVADASRSATSSEHHEN